MSEPDITAELVEGDAFGLNEPIPEAKPARGPDWPETLAVDVGPMASYGPLTEARGCTRGHRWRHWLDSGRDPNAITPFEQSGPLCSFCLAEALNGGLVGLVGRPQE